MRVLIIFISFFYSFKVGAQGSIYSGGEGVGYASDSIMDSSLIYKGGENSGYSRSILYGNPEIYSGGADDGYSNSIINGLSEIYSGGSDDGYSLSHYIGLPSIYKGGTDDGYVSSLQYGSPQIYQGGSNDGYDMVSYYVPFVWTGAIGSGWNVPGNWNSNVIPTHNRPTIIPANVPNYPAVNAGLFSIGEEYRQADFYSSQLWVRQGALLTTRINCEVILYGNALIDGTWNVRNLSPGSLLNRGTLEINGSLIFNDN
jgi:hypothetical protein